MLRSHRRPKAPEEISGGHVSSWEEKQVADHSYALQHTPLLLRHISPFSPHSHVWDTDTVIIAILQRRKTHSDRQAASHPASTGKARKQPGLCDLNPPTPSISLCRSLILPLTPCGHCWAPPGRSQCKKEKELESQLDNDRLAPLCDPPL